MPSSQPQSLRQAYTTAETRYAACTHCLAYFVDDLPNFGSLRCPQCPEVALVRGLTAKQARKLIQAVQNDD